MFTLLSLKSRDGAANGLYRVLAFFRGKDPGQAAHEKTAYKAF